MKLIKQIWNKPELRILIKFTIFTIFATVCGLAFRYLLLDYMGIYSVVLFGRTIGFTITDNTAYIAYYISSVLILYLLKWFHAESRPEGAFLPKLLSFSAIQLVAMIVGSYLLTLMTDRWGIHHEPAFWITCPITFVINYLGSRLLVFADSENKEKDKIISQSKAGDSSRSEEGNDGGKKECE